MLSYTLLILAISFGTWSQSTDQGEWEERVSVADRAASSGDYTAELEALQSALALAQRFGSNDLRLAGTYERLGRVFCDRGELRRAEAAYLRSLRIWEAVAPADTHVSILFMGLTTVYTWTGQKSKAERFARRAIAIQEPIVARNNDAALLVIPLQNLAVVLQTEHHFGEARNVYGRARAILDDKGQGNELLAALVQGNLGRLLARMGLTEEAIKELKAAIAIADAQPSARPLAIIAFRTSLAEMYCKDRRWNDAYQMIRDAKDAAEAALGPDHFAMERILLTYADVLRHMHRRADAIAMDRRARSIHGKFYSDNAVGLTIDALSLRNESR